MPEAERFVVFQTGTPMALQDLLGSTAGNTTLGLVTLNMITQLIGANVPIFNGMVVASVAANALTVSIKTLSGADPSATDPVYFFFKDPTSIVTGGYSVVTITSATSITLDSGVMINTTNAIPFRLYLVVLKNGTGVSLGLTKLSLIVNTTRFQYKALNEGALVTTVAQAGSGAGVFATIYTTSALVSVPFRYLAYIDFSNGQAAAGAWATAPDVIVPLLSNSKKVGDRLQFVDSVGSLATNPSVIVYTTITNSPIVITPFSKINAIKVQYSGSAQAGAGGAGVNTEVFGIITNTTQAITISTQVVTGVVSGAGSNIQSDGNASSFGINCPMSVAAQTYAYQHRGLNTSGTITTAVNGCAEEIMG